MRIHHSVLQTFPNDPVPISLTNSIFNRLVSFMISNSLLKYLVKFSNVILSISKFFSSIGSKLDVSENDSFIKYSN